MDKNIVEKIKITCDTAMYSFTVRIKINVEHQIKHDEKSTRRVCDETAQLLAVARSSSATCMEKWSSNSIYIYNGGEVDSDIELNKEQSLRYLRHTHEGRHVFSGYNFRKRLLE